MRKAYNARRRSRSGSRSRSYRVKARCVRGSGADPSHHVPKRDRVIPKLKKGTLRSQGYDTKESASDRHAALRRAVRKYGYRTVMGKVNAVYVLNRNKPVGRVFESDKTWLKETYGRDVITATVDTGGIDEQAAVALEERAIADAAREAGGGEEGPLLQERFAFRQSTMLELRSSGWQRGQK